MFRFALIALLLTISGCMSAGDINSIIGDIDHHWKLENNSIKDKLASKQFKISPDIAFKALIRSVEKLNFVIKDLQDKDKMIHAVAAAPSPLTDSEWEEIKEIEEPKMKKIASKNAPISSMFFSLHTDEVEIHVIGLVKPVYDGSEVILEFTMVDNKMKNMGLIGGEEPPPLVLRPA
jgi:hypothetical protein